MFHRPVRAWLKASVAVITPRSVAKRIDSLRDSIWEADYVTVAKGDEPESSGVPAHELPSLIEALREEMNAAAKELEFEHAAELRDRIQALERERLKQG